MRTGIGLVEATAVAVVAVEAISDAEARRAGAASREELLAGLARYPQRPVFRIGLRFAGPDPRIAMREQADLSDEEHARLVGRLDRLDRASRHGPWTRATLATIDRRPATRAAELAQELGRDDDVQARRAQAEGARPHGIARHRLPPLAAGSRPPTQGVGESHHPRCSASFFGNTANFAP
ncbi:MAG: hypothetical protein WKF33_13680 [Thermoleophilaceae bacterium]